MEKAQTRFVPSLTIIEFSLYGRSSILPLVARLLQRISPLLTTWQSILCNAHLRSATIKLESPPTKKSQLKAQVPEKRFTIVCYGNHSSSKGHSFTHKLSWCTLEKAAAIQLIFIQQYFLSAWDNWLLTVVTAPLIVDPRHPRRPTIPIAGERSSWFVLFEQDHSSYGQKYQKDQDAIMWGWWACG